MYRQSEKNLVNSSMSSTCFRNMVNLGLLTAEICCLGHPSKFQLVSRLAFVTAATSLTIGQPNFARCLAVSRAAIHCINFWGLLPPDTILPGAKLTLRPSLAFAKTRNLLKFARVPQTNETISAATELKFTIL